MWNQQGAEDSSLKERVLAGSRVLGCFMEVKVWGEGEGTGRKVLGTQSLVDGLEDVDLVQGPDEEGRGGVAAF